MAEGRLEQLFAFLEEDPNDAFTLYSIAYEYLQIGQAEKALDYFQKLRKTQPEYLGTYYHLGKTLELQGQKTEAITIYKEGIAMSEKKGDFHALSELRSALNSALGIDFEDEV